MLQKAQSLNSDQIFLDLEDSVAPPAKEQARVNIIEALKTGNWGDRVVVVRVNDWSTQWTYRDVITVVEAAGQYIDAIMLPKVTSAAQVIALDMLLTQIERENGYPVGAIGIEAQLENAEGLNNVNEIAQSSKRLETLVFGPADFMASLNMKSLVVGGQPEGYPADAYHYIFMRMLMAARANGLQAIDGPFGMIRDLPGFEEAANRSAALGYDGKWALNPAQIDPCNAIYSPDQEDYDKSEEILDAYAWYTSEEGGALGAVMLGDDFIDEASRKMAVVIAGKGRSAGMSRTRNWAPPA
jgi:citrate lyase subunit beta/citryl-CoA lyase